MGLGTSPSGRPAGFNLLVLVSTGGGPLPDLRQEGVGLQQLVRERRGGPDGPGEVQLPGGDPGAPGGPRGVPLVAELGPNGLQPAGRAGPADQELPGGVQPLHLVHHGGPGGDLEEPAEDHQGPSAARRFWRHRVGIRLTVLVLSAGEGAGAAEGAEEAGGERQAASGVRSARQRLPPVAAGDQVGSGPVLFQSGPRIGSDVGMERLGPGFWCLLLKL